jgi:ABC-2 type transport system permease protein
MLAALVYLQSHSIKNRTLGQLKRLKQPKYLVFCLVGAFYFYFFFFRRVFAARAESSGFDLSPEAVATYEALGAMGLMTILLLAWIVPHQRVALAFTEAEVAFLFPAPISRRGLIHFKLLRSQTAILFTTVLLTVITNRFGGNALLRAAGWWLILSVMNLHFLGSSFARTMLLDRGITNWQRRVGILLVLLVVTGVIGVWAKRTLPVLDLSNLDIEAAQEYVRRLLVSGPMPYLLYPFRLVIRPFLAADALAFARALGPALLLLVLHYAWVIRADVAFEEASAEASKKLAEKIAAVRAGNWQASRAKVKRKRAPFTLRPTGPPAVALLWKNLISAGQAFTFRVWVMFAAVAIGACVGLRHSAGGSGLLPALGTAAAFLMVWSLLIGAQFLRQDLRQDLALADVLKTFPLKGWQIVLGELLAPAVILTGIQWFLLIVAIGLFSQGGGGGLFGWSSSLFVGSGLALLFPMLNLITLQIPNAAVLVFPAWFQAGKQGPHGIEATGQRLIFLLGQLLIFILALIPAAAVFAGLFFLLKLVMGVSLSLSLAFVGAAVVLAMEAALGLMLLGWLFERFDVSAEMGL